MAESKKKNKFGKKIINWRFVYCSWYLGIKGSGIMLIKNMDQLKRRSNIQRSAKDKIWMRLFNKDIETFSLGGMPQKDITFKCIES